MIFTGKNKEHFEKWFLMSKIRNQFTNLFKIETGLQFRSFCLLPFEMQQGVYLDYFDSIGVHISDEYNEISKWFQYFIFSEKYNRHESCGGFYSRKEMLQEAFKKADELINTLEK